MERIKDKHITIRKATCDETPKGMFNQPLIMEVNDNGNYFKQILNCGTKDTIVVFKEEHDYYILSYNENLGYVGLQYVGEEYDDKLFLDNFDSNDIYFDDEEALLDFMITNMEN